jgi:hypothetical protein
MTPHPHRALASAALTACLLALASSTAAVADDADRVSVVQGSVEIGRGEPPVWRAAEAGDTLQPGDLVRTGDDGRAELLLDGATVRLYRASLLQLPGPPAESGAAGQTSRLRIERGRSLFDVLRAASERTLEVETREVVVSVKGTRFSVDAGQHSVAVFRGAVGVRDRLAEAIDEIMVREGFALARADGGMLELMASRAADPWARWEQGGAFPARLDDGALLTPGEGELSQAVLAARELAKPKAIEQAIERRPALKQRVEQIVAMQQAREAGSGDAIDDGASKDVDGVVDVRDAGVRRTLAQKYAQILANGGIPGAQTAGGGTFAISFVSGSGTSGGDQVQIEDPVSGYSASFDESYVASVLDGSSSFPSLLVNALGTQGVTETQFAQALMVIFDSN